MADTRWLATLETDLQAAGGVFEGFTSKGHRRWRLNGRVLVLPDPSKHATVTRHSKANTQALVARMIRQHGRLQAAPPGGPGLSEEVGLSNPDALLLPPAPAPLPPELEPPGIVLPALQTPREYPPPREYRCPVEGCPKPGPYPTPHHYAVHVRFAHPRPKAPQRAQDAPGSTPAVREGLDPWEALLARLDALTARVARLEDWTRGVPHA